MSGDGLGAAMSNIKLVDMRAREVFQVRDLVEVIDTSFTGRILEIDPDGRLARVDTKAGEKWFYLKDLKLK